MVNLMNGKAGQAVFGKGNGAVLQGQVVGYSAGTVIPADFYQSRLSDVESFYLMDFYRQYIGTLYQRSRGNRYLAAVIGIRDRLAGIGVIGDGPAGQVTAIHLRTIQIHHRTIIDNMIQIKLNRPGIAGKIKFRLKVIGDLRGGNCKRGTNRFRQGGGRQSEQPLALEPGSAVDRVGGLIPGGSQIAAGLVIPPEGIDGQKRKRIPQQGFGWEIFLPRRSADLGAGSPVFGRFAGRIGIFFGQRYP
ncbi:MAG: hypothetical protein BWY71_01775 [Planctomycetes bacterium ADurb.Bin412]|nr:MAG: hypothetical protein BWY71_01775 [Planctomycetes bacterium ADurb.Bin412]